MGVIELTEEQRMIRDTIARLAREKIAPRASDADRTQEYPWDLHRIFIENNLFKLRVPEEYGGMPVDITTCCIVIEEIAKVDGASANTVAHHQAGLGCFLMGANDDQRKRYLPKIGRGDYLVGFAMTEPGAGSDAFSLKTRAEPFNGGYRLNGTKVFISNSGLTDLYVIFATIDPSRKREGITAFLMEKETPGFYIGKKEDKMGFRASPTCELIFQDVILPRSNILGEEGKGWEIVLKSLTEMRVIIAAIAIGIAEGAMEVAIKYAKERIQFGRPIMEFQGVSFMLADMAIQVEAARALTYAIASLVDKGFKGLHPYASMAKCFSSDVAMRVTTDAVQVLGAYGYTREFQVERMMRDAKATQIIEGTNQIQRVQIARHLMKAY
jgi:alkylation response protein AidB-like acyl-CoA dehydrogenase